MLLLVVEVGRRSKRTLVMVLHENCCRTTGVLREQWLQTRVTLRDVQQVPCYLSIKQLRDAWLRGGTTVVDSRLLSS